LTLALFRETIVLHVSPFWPASSFRKEQAMTQPSAQGKSKVLAGVLNIVLPGVGNIYIGYIGKGVGQLILWPVCGIGWIWALIDAIGIFQGKTKDSQGNDLV
jgi:TM2 domain-containing membrane protein YozV